MPFTPSHIAAILPLRGRWVGLPLAALAAGSMSPDLPYFLPILRSAGLRSSTHSLLGVVSWNLVFGLVMWALWRVVAHTLRDLSPNCVRERWRPASWPSSRWWPLPVVAALIIGSLTHIGWDAFTHIGGFGPTHIPALEATYPGPLGPMQGYRYLQYASGLFGLVAIVWVGRRQPRRHVAPRRHPQLARLAGWVIVAGGALSIVVRLATTGAGSGLRELAFTTITAGITGIGAAVLALCASHAIWSMRTGSRAGFEV